MASSRSKRVEYDRFIPFRSTMDMDYARFALTTPSRPRRDGSILSPSSVAYQKLLDECILKNMTRILAFKSAPDTSASQLPQFDEPIRLQKKQQRQISKEPERVLDAPGMLDEDGLNLLDWGSKNMLAIALGDKVCLWDDANKSTKVLLEAVEGSGPITSISWSPDSTVLAVALGNSVLALVDPATGQDVNVTEDDENLTPVLSLAWRSNSILTAGRSDGTVVDYDFRKDDTSICFYNGHRRGVCSLKWSDNRRYLASGGHDKLVHIWDACMPVSHRHPRRHQWLHRISSHTSIVKALDWCPTEATYWPGGGRHDHCIKFWNTVNGSCLNSIDAGSEVCALLWDKNKSELVTSHGFPKNQLTLWNYPSMTRAAELFGHSSRVHFLAGSPLGGVVASAAADETLKFWNIFETPKPTKPELPFARFNSCTETFGGIKVATHFHGGNDCKRLRVAQRSLVELKWQHIFMEVWLQAPKVTTFAIRGYGGCANYSAVQAIEGSGPITSISWSPDSTVLAVAFGNSVLALVDPATGQDVNVTEDDENLTPVLSFAWRSNSILTVGSSDGTVVDYDFRKDDTSICFYNGHRRGVCSLKWSDNRRYLASGGHDKLVHIWDACMPVSHHHPRRHQWLHRISSHTSIVKALDWWPTRSNQLVSGGGRNDQCIKFWNTVNGSCLNSIDAGSEVCALLWDKNKSELLTSHGFPKNQLTLWNYPSMTRAAELFGHSSRVHFLAGSPLGGVVASAAADETLKLEALQHFTADYESNMEDFSSLEKWCKMGYNASSKIWIYQSLQMLNYRDSGVVPVLVDNGSSLNPKASAEAYVPTSPPCTTDSCKHGYRPLPRGRRRSLSPPSPPPPWLSPQVDLPPSLTPGPSRLPIIGALPLVGAKAHANLARLAKRYGPIMFLRLGSHGCVVASNADAARAFLKTHDAQFANRPDPLSARDVSYQRQDLVMADYNPTWKLLRKVCSLHMLGGKAFAGWAAVRRDEFGRMIRSMHGLATKGEPVVLSDVLVRAGEHPRHGPGEQKSVRHPRGGVQQVQEHCARHAHGRGAVQHRRLLPLHRVDGPPGDTGEDEERPREVRRHADEAAPGARGVEEGTTGEAGLHRQAHGEPGNRGRSNYHGRQHQSPDQRE
ncbi:Anaphase-promoting complex subunit [Musa troglodytarum]|uniref:Anaphase-promoting complex subunit n=1 Tax=Musa troglodytarum TaxID=320322 RepID=A0A9E7I9A7_9LILI|nr:Anaphase-promoting complex subunit [Musa troglodytarum]